MYWYILFLSHCLLALSSSWPSFHFDDHISIFASALISIYHIIICSEWNSITFFLLTFQICTLFKILHAYLQDTFIFFKSFLLVVALDSAFRMSLALPLHSSSLPASFTLCCSTLALRLLLLPCSASSLREWGSVETDSWSASVFTEKRKTAHSDPPSRPPVQPSSAPLTPPPHPPGWKFLVCGPNSKIPNLSDLPGEQQCIDSHSRTHAH